MTKDVNIQLLIPYAKYDISYNLKEFRPLEEKQAYVVLAIVSNKQQHPTWTLHDTLCHFYNINDEYANFFASAYDDLLLNETLINNKDQVANGLNCLIGNITINEKTLQYLQAKVGFYGNKKTTTNTSRSLQENLILPNQYQDYQLSDMDDVAYTSKNACSAFEKISSNVKVYGNKIHEWINNMLNNAKQLFSIKFGNEDAIKTGKNLFYKKTWCNFKVSVDGNNIEIFPQGQLENKIYEDYYLTNTYYQDLLQLICNQISINNGEINLVASLPTNFTLVNNRNLDLNKLLMTNHHTYVIDGNTLQELVIYQHNVIDSTNHHGTIKELYGHHLSEEELKEVIKNNLNDCDFISTIYGSILNETIKSLIVDLIIASHSLTKLYQSLINENSYNFIFSMLNNNYWIEDVYNLTGEPGATFYLQQIQSVNLFLSELKELQIYSPKLQSIIINHFDFDYFKLQTYLKNSEQETNLINLFATFADLQNQHQINSSEVNELQKELDLMQTDLHLTCLATLQANLQALINLHHLDLNQELKIKIKQLAKENKSLLEVKLWPIIANSANVRFSFIKLTNYIIEHNLLSDEELNLLEQYKKLNSSYLKLLRLTASNDKQIANDYQNLQAYHNLLAKLIQQLEIK